MKALLCIIGIAIVSVNSFVALLMIYKIYQAVKEYITLDMINTDLYNQINTNLNKLHMYIRIKFKDSYHEDLDSVYYKYEEEKDKKLNENKGENDYD